ncbi:hypothetical protein PPGU16_82030 (plasmid) [Paraburkholderia largidicola]|uniref:Uncharacterized protein n=1 Tax=Paraburkholderia largidicola TaxID=3014751 RepID=A0A7I8C234_9BURK|nr:hypothetical protein PPGU16_82030 [Paraburkholderia sp. PGU16]
MGPSYPRVKRAVQLGMPFAAAYVAAEFRTVGSVTWPQSDVATYAAETCAVHAFRAVACVAFG